MTREERLFAYRCAIATAGNGVDTVEDLAHALLAAERPAADPVATGKREPEFPAISWHHAALSVAVCRMSTRAVVLWGDIHHTPGGWVARIDQADDVFEHREDAMAAVEIALLARLAKLTGAE